MYINYKERPTGQEKTKIIHADVLPALVRKLNETGQAPELDLNKELNLIHRLIRMVEESEEVQ
ncbi:hypothetical protein D3C85_1854450 [compost metagenome]